MRSIVFFILCFSIITTISSQTSNNQACMSTLHVDPIIEDVEKIHYIFTGSDTTGLNVKVTKIKIMDARKEMVKRRDKNCTLPNIEDCYVQVLEDIPAVTMNLYTISGPEVTEEYEIRKEMVKVEKRSAGDVEIAVVCQKNRSKSLILKIQTALIQKGYPLSLNGTLDQATTLSITDFQKNLSLAYGDLTLETLSALDVK